MNREEIGPGKLNSDAKIYFINKKHEKADK
jgi:hypothetical protein